jgi:serine O-acetyltransferase
MQDDDLAQIADGILAATPVATSTRLPSRMAIRRLCDELLHLLFPGTFSDGATQPCFRPTLTRHAVLQVRECLLEATQAALTFAGSESADHASKVICDDFLGQLPQVTQLLASDTDAFFANDPSATSTAVILVSYPGIEAIAIQRLAHVLYSLVVPLVPRMMTEEAHSRTGIDIHPGARIGAHFAIDHGTGIVIGETTTIGESCMLYHGVTLGAFNPTTKDAEGNLQRGAGNKRHPDLEDHITVYPGATILGGGTRIGHHSTIGGNVWLTQSVAAYSLVTIKDPELLVRTRNTTNGGDFSI